MILFHHALGLTPGVRAFADSLRASGHHVLTPDLFEGATFDYLEQGVAHAETVGMEQLLARGGVFADDHPTEAIYAGFSLGALIAHDLAQTRPEAKGAILYHYGDVPFDMFGETWPKGVPVQFHIALGDPFREPGIVEEFAAAVNEVATAELFEYPGSGHLFTDPAVPEFDPSERELAVGRSADFLRRCVDQT